MKNYLMIGYEAAASFIPWMAIYLAGWRSRSQLTQAERRKRLVLCLVFAVYVCGVLYFTGAGTLYDFFLYGIHDHDKFNLLPFSRTIDQTAYLLNVVYIYAAGIFTACDF